MEANVESMFYVREKPWHGLGMRVQEALSSSDGSGAIKVALTPIRVVYQNTLNLALSNCKAFLVYDPYQEHTEQAGRSKGYAVYGGKLHGQLGKGSSVWKMR